MQSTADLVKRASGAGLVIPAFNVPYLPMVRPVIQAIVDQDCFALVEVARLEWIKFQAVSPAAVMAEFQRWNRPEHVRIHLDHVPAIDEDGLQVDFLSIIAEGIRLGYHSVMIDGSRLDLEGNIAATRQAVEMAHRAGIPCEAELGFVLGHESSRPLPYEQLFQSRRGFTDPEEAKRFVEETDCDWLSVAIGNVHGAISGALKDKPKIEARLDLEHLEKLRRAAGIPLVLHGGSGVRREHLRAAVERGFTKVNIATEIRQAFEVALAGEGGMASAQRAVYERTCSLLRDYLGVAGARRLIVGEVA